MATDTADLPKRCGVSDSVRLVLPAGARPWPQSKLTYRIDAYLDGLSPATQDDVHAAAFKGWAELTPLRFTQVARGQPADIILSTGRGPRSNFDGSSGVLAWMELPNGSGQPVHGRFDLDERWSNDPNRDVYLLAVSAHELGHALGLDHDTDRSVALMDPLYSRQVFKPQPNDVRRIQSLFGGPTDDPVDPPSPPDDGDGVSKFIKLIQLLLKLFSGGGDVSSWLELLKELLGFLAVRFPGKTVGELLTAVGQCPAGQSGALALLGSLPPDKTLGQLTPAELVNLL